MNTADLASTFWSSFSAELICVSERTVVCMCVLPEKYNFYCSFASFLHACIMYNFYCSFASFFTCVYNVQFLLQFRIFLRHHYVLRCNLKNLNNFIERYVYWHVVSERIILCPKSPRLKNSLKTKCVQTSKWHSEFLYFFCTIIAHVPSNFFKKPKCHFPSFY